MNVSVRNRKLPLRRPSARSAAFLPLLGFLAACTQPLDFDLRGQIGAFNTTEAAQKTTVNRPKPDARGLITYPNYQVAVARRGDTVTSVARRVGIPADALARFNGVQPGDKLRADEVLVLPGGTTAGTPGGAVDIAALAGQAIDNAPDTTPAVDPVETTQLPPAVQTGPEPVRHRVERGETAYTISRLYQVPVRALAEWNGLGPDFAVREGQFLLIPVEDRAAPAVSPVARTTQPGEGSSTPTPPSATKPLPDEKIAATPVEPPKVKVAPPTRAPESELAWPVQGRVIRTYAKGRNEGIDISAAPGTAVGAAEKGTVVAITEDTNQVPIIVVRHQGQLLTVYANVTNIKVSRGDSVARGQQIAELREGDNAHVHFEVRNGVDSVNPQPYLE